MIPGLPRSGIEERPPSQALAGLGWEATVSRRRLALSRFASKPEDLPMTRVVKARNDPNFRGEVDGWVFGISCRSSTHSPPTALVCDSRSSAAFAVGYVRGPCAVRERAIETWNAVRAHNKTDAACLWLSAGPVMHPCRWH